MRDQHEHRRCLAGGHVEDADGRESEAVPGGDRGLAQIVAEARGLGSDAQVVLPELVDLGTGLRCPRLPHRHPRTEAHRTAQETPSAHSRSPFRTVAAGAGPAGLQRGALTAIQPVPSGLVSSSCTSVRPRRRSATSARHARHFGMVVLLREVGEHDGATALAEPASQVARHVVVRDVAERPQDALLQRPRVGPVAEHGRVVVRLHEQASQGRKASTMARSPGRNRWRGRGSRHRPSPRRPAAPPRRGARRPR